jgi:hypothetical protein
MAFLAIFGVYSSFCGAIREVIATTYRVIATTYRVIATTYRVIATTYRVIATTYKQWLSEWHSLRLR